MPRLDQKTRERVLEVHFRTDGQKPLNAREILDKLQKDNNESGTNYVIPNSERSIQKLIKKVREQETETIALDRQPWSLALNKKAGIAFDPILFDLLKVHFERFLQRGGESEFVPFSVGIARWAVWIHKAAPQLTPEALPDKARTYSAKDRLSAIAEALPDSSFEDLEIVLQTEDDPDLRKAYQKLLGRDIEIIAEKSQTDIGEVNVIHVQEKQRLRLYPKKKRGGIKK